MPPRSQPTARQERLGAELRKLREAAGKTAREAAGLLGTNSVQMSQLESGKAGISEDRLRRLAAHYACSDQALIDALTHMATDRTRGWWEKYRGILPPGFLDLSELEHHAIFLRIIATAHVPGILQTQEYARAIFSFMIPELPPRELEARVAHRAQRRVVFTREAPTEYEAVIHESALRIHVADSGVTRRQLGEILELADRGNITVRVIPFEVTGFAGANLSLRHAVGTVPQLDTVQRDTAHGSAFVTATAEVARLRTLFDKVEAMSLDPVGSHNFIYRMLRNL